MHIIKTAEEPYNQQPLLKMRNLPAYMRKALSELKRNDPLRLAAATAFFSTFALPPILIILIQLFGLVFNRHQFINQVVFRLSNLFGRMSAEQVVEVLNNVNSVSKNIFALVSGFIFLLFVATTLFTVIKNSLNQIWNIQVIKHPGLWFYFKMRARSLMMILLAGILLMFLVTIESIEVILGFRLNTYYAPGNLLYGIVNELLFIAIMTVWFSTIFRYLTDGKPNKKVVVVGATFTAILFALGKVVFKSLLFMSNIGTIYGASGSFVFMLLFLFYSSMIFYYGGCFIKVISDDLKKPITPGKKAFRYRVLQASSFEQID